MALSNVANSLPGKDGHDSQGIMIASTCTMVQVKALRTIQMVHFARWVTVRAVRLVANVPHFCFEFPRLRRDAKAINPLEVQEISAPERFRKDASASLGNLTTTPFAEFHVGRTKLHMFITFASTIRS